MKKVTLFIETLFLLFNVGEVVESTTVLQQILRLDGLENRLNLTKNCRDQLLETKNGIQRKELWGIKCECKIFE